MGDGSLVPRADPFNAVDSIGVARFGHRGCRCARRTGKKRIAVVSCPNGLILCEMPRYVTRRLRQTPTSRWWNS